MSETVIRLEQDPRTVELLEEMCAKLDRLLVPRVYTLEEAAELLQVGYSTAREMVLKGEIAAKNVGTGKNSHYRISADQLTDYLRANNSAEERGA
jgi:excisionase family DNA binding protein